MKYLKEDLSKLFGCLSVNYFDVILTEKFISAFIEQYVRL